jgi:hypothetical protein
MIDLWLGSREHLATTVLDESTSPPATVQTYDVAVIPFGSAYTETDWHPVVVYAGQIGVWVDATAVGVFRILARVGTGAPNERAIVPLDILTVRGR